MEEDKKEAPSTWKLNYPQYEAIQLLQAREGEKIGFNRVGDGN